MANERFQDLTRRPFPTRAASNRMQDAIEMLTRPYGNNGVGVELTSAGPEFSSTLPPRLQARITGKDDSVPPKYSWEEIGRDDAGVVIDHHDPRVGTADAWPAFERSGAEDVSTDGSFVAELVRGAGEYYEFSLGTGGGGGESLTNTQCRGGSVTLGPNETKFVPFTPATGVGSQPYFQGDPGIFKKSSGNFDHGYYHLSGSCFIESSDCLSVYHCAWYGDTQATWPGVAVAGAPNGGKIQIVSSTHILINAFLTTSFFKFGVFHTGTDTVQVSGGNFGITKLGAE